MLCGIIDKHPNDKAVRRNLSQQVTKCETELANLQSDYNSKLSAYKTVEDSFARKIEADIVASNPDRHIVNGVKNWALLNKHVALLQKRCNGKLPPRHSVVNLLKVAVEEHELKSQRLHAKERFVNPQKHILEDEYVIRFPRRSPSTARACSSSSFPGSSLLSEVILEWQFFDIVHQLQVRLLIFPAHRSCQQKKKVILEWQFVCKPN